MSRSASRYGDTISPYFLDRNLEDFVSVIRLADLPNYGPNYGEEEEGRET